MTDSPAEVRARLYSPGEYGRYGSAIEHQRYIQRTSKPSRRRCGCGCNGRVTHAGMANGLCLTSGCELSMRRWVRDPHSDVREQMLRHEEERMKLPNSAVRCSVTDCTTPPVRRPEGMNLTTLRAHLRPDGWRYVDGQSICPQHPA
jgi:hypothetical protein